MLQNPILDADTRATFSFERQKMIAQYKFDLMKANITINEEIIRRYTNLIANEKKKLTDTANGQVPLPKLLVTILNLIASRQSNIVKRAQVITKQKIYFFDYAPSVIEKPGTDGAIF